MKLELIQNTLQSNNKLNLEITEDILSKVNNLKKENLYENGKLNSTIGVVAIDIHNWYIYELNKEFDIDSSMFKPIKEEFLKVADNYEQSLVNLVILDILCNVINYKKNYISKTDVWINWTRDVLDNIKKYNDESQEYAISTIRFIRDYFGDAIYPEYESGYWLPDSKSTHIHKPEKSLTTDNYIQELFDWILASHPKLLSKVTTLNSIINPDIETNLSEHISICLQHLENNETYDPNLPELEF